MKTHIRIASFFIGLTLLLPLLSTAQVNPAVASALQKSLDSLCKKHQVKGITAAAYIPGQGMWKGVTGISHGTVPIDTTMLFNMGSVTKTYVAAEIFRLIENGQLTLNDSLKDYIRPHPYIDSTITVKQLLGHKSGLGDFTNMQWQNAMFADLTRVWYSQEVIDSFLTAPAFAKGTKWSYCNANYLLLGMIIEKIKNDSLHKVLRNEFFTPLGLNNTYMHIFEKFSNPIPHHWSAPNMNPAQAQDVSSYPDEALFSSPSAAGGLFSDAADIASFGYKLFTGRIISKASVAQMITWTNLNASYYNGYGLGTMRFSNRGRTYYGHAGNFIGYAGSMLFYPKDSICVGMLINTDCISPNLAVELFDALITAMNPTHISEAMENTPVNVYPNPASERIFVEISPKSSAPAIISVYDISGKLCFVKETGLLQPDLQTITVPVEHLSPGFYICQVKTGETTVNRKFIINRD